MPNPNRRTLLEPSLVTGFATARHPSALPQGVMSALYDFRLDDGTVRTRWGSVSVCAAVNGTQTYRGSFETRMSGVPTIFVATAAAGKVVVCASTDDGATFTALPMTSPDVRLTDVGPVFFALTSYRSQDYLVVQNGTDAPRYWDGTSVRIVPTLDTTGYKVRTNVDLGGGTVFSGSVAVAFSGSTEWDHTTTQVMPFGSGGNMLYLQCDGHVTTLQYATCGPLNDPFTVPTDLNRQIVFVLDAGTPLVGVVNDTTPYPAGAPDERWRLLTIEGSPDGSTWFPIYDPAVAGLITVPIGLTMYLAAVPVTSATSGKTVNYLRFSYPPGLGFNSDPDIITRFYTFQASGPTIGGAAFGAAFGQTSTTVAADGPTRSNGILSTTPTTANYGGVAIPVSTLVGYSYRVTVTKPSSGVVVPTYVYRKDIGTVGYYLAGSFLGPGSYVDTGGVVDLTQPLPDASALGLPIGTSMATANGRLLVCGGDRFWYSADSNPFNYSRLVLFDNDASPVTSSGGSFSKPGERFQAVLAVGIVPTGAEADGTPQTGAVTTYVATDRTLYVLSGWDALSLNKSTPIGIGTRSPLSFARNQSGGFFFLDAQSQVRQVYGTQTKAISKYQVDDVLRGIPASRLLWVCGACLAERMYMAFTPLGGTANTQALVYNDAFGWESIDRPPYSMQGLGSYYAPSVGRVRLYAFSDVALNEHAAPGSTSDVGGGAKIAARVVFPEQSNKPDVAVNLSAFFIVSDVDLNGTATVSALCTTGNGAGTIVFNAISLTAPSIGAARVARRTVPTQGAETLTVVPTLDVLASGGTRILRVDMESSGGTSLSTQ